MKADQGGEVFSAAREEEVLANVLAANKGPLDEVTIKADLPRTHQRLAGHAEESRRSHSSGRSTATATSRRSSGSARRSVYIRTGNIAAVFEEVSRKHADFGVVPLENSTDGRIADTLDMFIRMPQIKICSEIRLRVHHHLLANCEQTEIRRVY